ncbi:Odorant receptor 13a [Anthophora quadrimaculata]
MTKMARNERAEEDLKYATGFLKPILGSIGAWPAPPDSSSFMRFLQKTEHVFTYILFSLTIVPGLSYAFLKERDGKVRLKFMLPIFNTCVQFCKYWILVYRAKNIQNGLNMIRNDWIEASEENRLIFRSKAKLGRRVVLIAGATIYGGGLCYRTILPYLTGTVVTANNVTIRPLPCSVYFVFFNEQQTPNYEIIFIMQAMTGFIAYSVICGTCGICALFVFHACSMLKILVNKINALADKTDITEALVHRKIADIVEYQTKIKGYLKNIETVTEYICLADVVGGTVLVCLLYYCLLLELENNNTTAVVVYITLQISYSFCIFILCYIGQLLIDENYVVGLSSCTVNWYRLPMRHARSLIMIIAMSNYPIRITAGKMCEMSLATFTDVMKVAVGYFNILRKVI